MTLPQEQPPRRPGEIAQYEDDPFDLGEIDDAQLAVVEDVLPPEEWPFERRQSHAHPQRGEPDLFQRAGRAAPDALPRMIRNLIDTYVKRQQSRP